MIFGKRPFSGKSLLEISDRVREGEITLPLIDGDVLPEQLKEMLLKLLAKEASDRYQSADAVLADLFEFEHGDSLGSGPHTVSQGSQSQFVFDKTETMAADKTEPLNSLKTGTFENTGDKNRPPRRRTENRGRQKKEGRQTKTPRSVHGCRRHGVSWQSPVDPVERNHHRNTGSETFTPGPGLPHGQTPRAAGTFKIRVG